MEDMMTNIPTDRPLTAGDVKLLREGDVLRVVVAAARNEEWDGVKQPAIGEEVVFIKPSGSGGVSNCIVTSFNPAFGYRPGRFTFVARPATSAESEGALAALICAILEDEGGSGAPWSVIADRIAASIIDENHLAVSSWTVRAALERIAGEQQYRSGHCQTDITVEPALSADEAQSLARETLAALASPPSERERELEGALRAIADASRRSETMFGGKMSDVTRVFQNITRVAETALTAQPAGEPTHG